MSSGMDTQPIRNIRVWTLKVYECCSRQLKAIRKLMPLQLRRSVRGDMMVSSMLSKNDIFVPLVASQGCPLWDPSSSSSISECSIRCTSTIRSLSQLSKLPAWYTCSQQRLLLVLNMQTVVRLSFVALIQVPHSLSLLFVWFHHPSMLSCMLTLCSLICFP